MLGRMAQQTEQDCDAQATFEIAQLQGLAIDVITKGNPQRDENLKRLVEDAVVQLAQSGWANSDGLQTGQASNYWCKYLRLAGADAGIGIEYEIAKRMPDKLLWISFYRYSNARVSLDEVRKVLGHLDEPGLKWRSEDVSVHISLPPAADHDAIIDSIVTQLTRIAKIIDPNGPTYRK